MAGGADVVVIEAPGKRRAVRRALRGLGLRAEVVATGGHFWAHPRGFAPLGIDAGWIETGRSPDPEVAERLRGACAGARVWLAMDDDDEGEAIALDVARTVGAVAETLVRVRLRDLSRAGLMAAFRAPQPFSFEGAIPGVVRRVLDRVIGAEMAARGVRAGRVSGALLGALAREGSPVIGEVDLVVPASDGGEPWRARVPVTAETEALWRARAAELAAGRACPVAGRVLTVLGPWNFADALLALERGR